MNVPTNSGKRADVGKAGAFDPRNREAMVARLLEGSASWIVPHYVFDSTARRTGLARWIEYAATTARAAISIKKLTFDNVDQKLPIQPAAIFPRKLVASQIPITVERDALEAMFDTNERPIGEK